MNAKMRQLVIVRDGFQCVHCHGACPLRGKDEPCQLPATTLAPVVYFKLEAGRHPLARLQVDHVHGKAREAWNEVATLCPCCHRHKVIGNAIFDAEVAYLATIGDAPQEYRDAQAKEAAAKPQRKAQKAKARKAVYKKAVAKHGKPKIPSRPMTPTPPTPKKGGSRWAWAPIHPTYQNPTR